MILETLAFDLTVHSPFDYAMKILDHHLLSHQYFMQDVAKCFSASIDTARESFISLSWAILRDSWQTDLIIRHSAYDIGCSCAYLAFLLIHDQVKSLHECDWETWTSRPLYLLHRKVENSIILLYNSIFQ
jgi:hypothetical protein